MFSKKRNLPIVAVAMILASSNLPATPATTELPPNTHTNAQITTNESDAEQPIDMVKVSEAFGHFIGRHLKSPGVNFEVNAVIKGIRDGAEGKPAPLSDKEYEQMMAQVQKGAFEKISKDNLKAANEYLERNAQKKEIISIQPGKLEYEILQAGTGETVAPHSSPQINYTGKFIDGSVFGSSADSGGPVTVPLDQTIQGFSQGIVGMKEGEKRRLYVHPDLGYGTAGHLPPNSLLIFDIEVIKAQTPEKSEQTSNDDNESDDDEDLAPLALSETEEDSMSDNYNDEDDRFDEEEGYDEE